jgi:hypothetical protein
MKSNLSKTGERKMKKAMTSCVILALAAACFGQDSLSLGNGTVVADWEVLDHPGEWFGEIVTTLTLGMADVQEGQFIEVTGMVTSISDPRDCWVEVGLIPKKIWDDWHYNLYGGSFKSAVFNKGLHFVSWGYPGTALGASVQEGWDNGTNATFTDTGAYAWPLNRPTQNNPWEFSLLIYTESNEQGQVYLWFDSGRIYGEEPLYFGSQEDNNNDYSHCYLIAQIWSLVETAQFSFENVQANVLAIEE